MLRINVNLYPKDGYFFVERDGIKIRAGNWTALFKKVREYRERAGFPVGDTEADVMAQACSRQPSYCHDDRPAPAPRVPPSLKSRVLQWLNRFVQVKKRGLSYVNDAEAKERAGICARCPNNTPLGVSSCSTCKEVLKAYHQELLGSSRFRDKRLGGCGILECDLVTAVHLDEIRVDNASLPANCWRKKVV